MARCRYEMPGHLLTGVCLKVENPSVHLWTDASLAGWGSHPPWWRVGGLWDSMVGHLHVIVLGDVGVSLASAFSGVGDCRYPPGVQHDGLGFCSVSRGDSFLPMLRRGQGSVSLGVGEPGDPDASICAEPPQCWGGCSIEVVHGGAARVGSQPLGLQSSLDLFASSVFIRVPLGVGRTHSDVASLGPLVRGRGESPHKRTGVQGYAMMPSTPPRTEGKRCDCLAGRQHNSPCLCQEPGRHNPPSVARRQKQSGSVRRKER